MRNFINVMLASLLCTAAASADITVNLPKGSTTGELPMERGYINRLVSARRGQQTTESATVKVLNGKAVINTLPDSAAQYVIPFGNRQFIAIYTEPGDNLTVNVTSEDPLRYTVTGSQLMEDISGMAGKASEYLAAYRAEADKSGANADTLQKYADLYDAVFIDYVRQHPDRPAAAYAMTQMDGEKFLEYYKTLRDGALKSPLMPVVEKQKAYVDRQVEMERRKEALASGNVDAPAFTYQDRNGKNVSLADFRGKWVIIDFWGSWCRWCIKGFPEMKEAYAKYKPQLEIIGIDCRDSRETWIKALDKYQLPWVNVYNPVENGGPLLEQYCVQGFPTKVIVDPQGKIRNITTGEDPAFYKVLDDLMLQSNGK